MSHEPRSPDIAPATERLLQVGDVELLCRDSGSGFPLVWGHGLMSCMDHEDRAGVFDWSAVTASNRLVRYDARGHGGSQGSESFEDYEWANLAQDMIGLADGLGLSDFVAGGASMGAATALWAAIIAPQRVKALILVAPPTAWDTRVLQARIYELASTATRLRLMTPLQLAARHLPVIAPRRSRWALTAYGPRYAASIGSHRLSVILRGASVSGMPLPERLADIDIPALILAWRGDRVHPVTTAEILHAGLPQSTLHVAEGDEEIHGWPELVRQFMIRFAL